MVAREHNGLPPYGNLMRTASAKPQSMRRTSDQAALMGSCLTMGHT